MQTQRRCQLYLSFAMVSAISVYIFLNNNQVYVHIVSGKYRPKTTLYNKLVHLRNPSVHQLLSNRSTVHLDSAEQHSPSQNTSHQRNAITNTNNVSSSKSLLHNIQSSTRKIEPKQVSSGTASTKLILLWTSFFDTWNYIPYKSQSFQTAGCPTTKCEITSNRNRLKDSDAVIFHIRDLSLLDIPRIRIPSQKWVFYSMEAPPYSYFEGFQFMRGMFNWTMSYRLDSDVLVPYGEVKAVDVNGKKATKTSLSKIWEHKNKMVVWLVSHCSTSSKRELFVKELKKYIDVDIFGSCGFAVCPKNKTEECLKSFEKQYMFFLSLENSVCKDYVTEKFFRILQYDIIPVVLGGANYKRVAPPHSYIDALSFKTPQDLSQYLYKVAGNYSLYRSYLDWKPKYEVNSKITHCELCAKLHSSDQNSSIYWNIEKWWLKGSKCYEWRSGKD